MSSKSHSKDFNEFLDSSLNIFYANPAKTRISVKFSLKKQFVILRVTNDSKSSICKLIEEEDKQKVDAFLKIFSRLLANTPEDEEKAPEENVPGLLVFNQLTRRVLRKRRIKGFETEK